MIISEIKVRLKELNTQYDVKWPVSGTKAELIKHLGWAEQPQAFDIFTDSSNRAWFQDTLGPHIVRFLGLRISCIK